MKIKCGLCEELGEFGEMVIARRAGIVHYNCASDNPILACLTVATSKLHHYLLGPDVPSLCGRTSGNGTLDLSLVNCSDCLEIFVSAELGYTGRKEIAWP